MATVENLVGTPKCRIKASGSIFFDSLPRARPRPTHPSVVQNAIGQHSQVIPNTAYCEPSSEFHELKIFDPSQSDSKMGVKRVGLLTDIEKVFWSASLF